MRRSSPQHLRDFLTAVLAAVMAVGSLGTASLARAEEDAHASLRQELHRIISEARDRVFPALVSIRVVTVRYAGGREHKGGSVGSGTIISPQGHVLTNHHVTRYGRKFICTLSDKREVQAELIGEDPLTDLALLRLDTEELDGAGEPLPVAAFGDSDRLEIGDYVMAMGSPFSLSRSVSLGIVSNTERVFAGGFGSDEVEEIELGDGQRTGLFTRWIQHDALINPGNSGGPLINLAGEIVGINELGGNAMGFAIPSKLAQRVADSLRELGEVPRSWIGVSFKPIRRTGLDEGVLIDSVIGDSPAARAGIRAGDVLVELAGRPLTVRFPEEVPLLLDDLASQPIGSSIEVAYLRDGERQRTTVVAEKLHKDVGDENALPAWGLTVREITDKMARDERLDTTAGVRVSGVRPGGPGLLAEPALTGGDVIRAVGGKPVADLRDLITRYEQITRNGATEVLIGFRRRGTEQVTLLEPRLDGEQKPPRELPKAWIGVVTQPVLPRLGRHLGLGDSRGFRVTRVYPDTEAAVAGLAVGDVIVALGKERLRPRGMPDAGLLQRRVRSLEIDDTVDLRVLRDGEEVVVEVVLERTRPTREEALRHRDSDFEIAVRELTFFDHDEQHWGEDVEGVLVEKVEAGGWAGLGGIRPNDLIRRIQGQPVRGLKTFLDLLRQVKDDQPERVEVVVLRGIMTRFQFLEPDWISVEDAPQAPEENR